ncbi:quinon protein alcohol dehydrogenase-like superfamily [Mycena leptocephala]|nr:quinon protein alcohol dehydrogenase-like superfamily [Mycena leptocephala]
MSTKRIMHLPISTDAARVATSTTNRLSVFSVMSGAAIWILACTHKGRIQLFGAASGHAIKELDIRVDDHNISHVAISPQNDYIAVVFLFHRVCIFRIEDGVMTWQSNESNTSCRGSFIDSISVSPDTALLAPCSISIWSTQSGQLVTQLEGHKKGISSTSFSSHGNLLISGSADQTVRVWQCCPQSQTWSCIAVLYGHSETVLSVAFLPDGKRIISAGIDRTIRIWDISAVLEGKEFEVQPEKGGLVVDAWFRQGICLGGWRMDEPFLFQYPFELPEGVQPLEWQIQSEQEDEGNDTKVNEVAD